MAFSRRIAPTLPVTDMNRAKKFYEGKLSLKLLLTSSSGAQYDCGGGTTIFLYKGKPSVAKHVVASFEVENIQSAKELLESKGIVFEEHNMPGIDTLANVGTIGPEKAAWFKDSEGNILALVQLGVMTELKEEGLTSFRR